MLDSATPWTVAHQASPSFTISWSLLKLMCCHPTVSSFVVPFSSYLQSFPASGSFPVSQLFASGGQSIRASPSASILPMAIQDWFPLGLTGLISLQSQQTLKSLLQFQQFKSIYSLVPSLLYGPTVTSIHDYWKNHSFNYLDLCRQVMSLLFNMLSWFVIDFRPRSKRLLISWLQSPICSDFGAQENKVCHCFHCFPIYLPWSDGTGCHKTLRR